MCVKFRNSIPRANGSKIKFHISKYPNVNNIKFHIETIPAALWNGDASSHVRHPALKLDHHPRSQQTKVFFVKKN